MEDVEGIKGKRIQVCVCVCGRDEPRESDQDGREDGTEDARKGDVSGGLLL